MVLQQRIKQFDFFAKKFSFNSTKNSHTFKTATGGAITLLGVTLILLISLRIFLEFMNSTKPVVSVNRVKLAKPTHLDLFKSDVGGGYIFFSGTKFLTTDESARYVTLVSGIITTTQEADGTIVNKEEFLPMGRCINSANPAMKELVNIGFEQTTSTVNYTALFANSIFCGAGVNSETWKVEGSSYNFPFRRYVVKVYPCSLPNPGDCASPQELSSVQIGTIPMIKVANYSDRRSPLEFFMDADGFYYFDIVSKTSITSYYKENFIYDDDMDMRDERLTHRYIDVDKVKTTFGSRVSLSAYCTAAQISSGQCEPYMELRIRSSFEKMIIQRRYKKFLESLSEIGGFTDLIIYGLWAVYVIYNSWAYHRWVRSELVDHFVELENEKRLGEKWGEGMSEGEVRRLKTLVLGKEGGARGERNMTFRTIFGCFVGFENLLSLSFKSEVLLETFLGEKRHFEALSERVYFVSRKSKKAQKSHAKLSAKVNSINPSPIKAFVAGNLNSEAKIPQDKKTHLKSFLDVNPFGTGKKFKVRQKKIIGDREIYLSTPGKRVRKNKGVSLGSDQQPIKITISRRKQKKYSRFKPQNDSKNIMEKSKFKEEESNINEGSGVQRRKRFPTQGFKRFNTPLRIAKRKLTLGSGKKGL